MVPAFIEGNFEARLAQGDRPGSGPDSNPDFYVWARHAGCENDGSVAKIANEVALLAIADMTPPAISPKFPKPAPIASATWLVNIMDTAPVAAADGGWWLLRICSSGTSSNAGAETAARHRTQTTPTAQGFASSFCE